MNDETTIVCFVGFMFKFLADSARTHPATLVLVSKALLAQRIAQARECGGVLSEDEVAIGILRDPLGTTHTTPQFACRMLGRGGHADLLACLPHEAEVALNEPLIIARSSARKVGVVPDAKGQA